MSQDPQHGSSDRTNQIRAASAAAGAHRRSAGRRPHHRTTLNSGDAHDNALPRLLPRPLKVGLDFAVTARRQREHVLRKQAGEHRWQHKEQRKQSWQRKSIDQARLCDTRDYEKSGAEDNAA